MVFFFLEKYEERCVCFRYDIGNRIEILKGGYYFKYVYYWVYWGLYIELYVIMCDIKVSKLL